MYRDDKSHVEKRLAAYLILMKNPDQALVRAILTTLENERDDQIKSFVLSHLNNILNSAEPQMDQYVLTITHLYIYLSFVFWLNPEKKIKD